MEQKAEIIEKDTINRQTVIEMITKAIWHYPNECYRNFNNYNIVEDFVSDIVKEIPSATPRGRWLNTGSGEICSYCGEIQYGYDNFRCFCAYCGSKNKREEVL